MKILSIGNFGTGWDGSICDEEHIASALEELGHQVIRHQRDQENIIPNSDIDFILLAQWDGYGSLPLKWFKEYYKCPIVYWAFDYQADGQAWHEKLINGSDLYLSKRVADSKYPNWQWFSQDFAPPFLKPTQTEKTIDVLFTGSFLPWAIERNETIKAVGDKFNLTIHSVTPDDWNKFGVKADIQGPIMDEGLPELYARAKVNLSIDHTIEAGYWSDRNAQIMCCGGYVLFRYVPLSESVFGPGVDYFYSVEDCLKKVDRALEDPEHRAMVANIGLNQATWTNRLRVHGRVWDLLTIVRSIL